MPLNRLYNGSAGNIEFTDEEQDRQDTKHVEIKEANEMLQRSVDILNNRFEEAFRTGLSDEDIK